MGVQTDIYTAAMTLLATIPTGTAVAWPNVDFKPPSGADALWLAADHFPNQNRELVMGTDGTLYLGFIQVKVYFRPNQGIVKALTEAEAVVDLFPKGTALGIVRVEGVPSIAPPVYDDDSGFVPVTILYRGIA